VIKCVAKLFFAIAVLSFARDAVGAVIAYECNALPANAGFTLLQAFCDPGEIAQSGLLVQTVEMCPGYDPPEGQQFDYFRLLDDFDGAPSFFVEWRAETTGDRAEIPYTAPAALVVGSFGPVFYHVTFARDQVRLIRDNLLPIIYSDTTADRPHTYRIELVGTISYSWYIDNLLIDAGIPEGAYPSFSPQLNIRAKARFGPSVTTWDYIRYGTIPQPSSGDFDSNGTVDANDAYFFLDCLLGPDSAGPGCRWADMNNDGTVNGEDVQLFAALLLDS